MKLPASFRIGHNSLINVPKHCYEDVQQTYVDDEQVDSHIDQPHRFLPSSLHWRPENCCLVRPFVEKVCAMDVGVGKVDGLNEHVGTISTRWIHERSHSNSVTHQEDQKYDEKFEHI